MQKRFAKFIIRIIIIIIYYVLLIIFNDFISSAFNIGLSNGDSLILAICLGIVTKITIDMKK